MRVFRYADKYVLSFAVIVGFYRRTAQIRHTSKTFEKIKKSFVGKFCNYRIFAGLYHRRFLYNATHVGYKYRDAGTTCQRKGRQAGLYWLEIC